MAKIQRATQKVFGSSADATAITQFGTAKNQNPTYTTDVETIQNNSTFLTGWANSLETDLAPFMQDSNALWYMITSQVAYLMQQGIPEYDADTEYSVGSLCKVISGAGAVTIYKSKTDNNIGHDVSNSTYWLVYSSEPNNLAQYEIGLPQATLSNTLLPNEVWLDGTVGAANDTYHSTIVNISTYQNLYNLWGTRFGGNGTTTFGLPNLTDRALWGVSSLSNSTGTGFVDATLPNIKGSISGSGTGADNTTTGATGAFYKIDTRVKVRNEDGDKDNYYGFNANRYNGIYQDNATVRPPAIKVRWKTRYY